MAFETQSGVVIAFSLLQGPELPQVDSARHMAFEIAEKMAETVPRHRKEQIRCQARQTKATLAERRW